MPGTLLDRASYCRGCGGFMGNPSFDDLKKLHDVERQGGFELAFYCDSCNDAFVKWYREQHGEDPTPACVLGDLN